MWFYLPTVSPLWHTSIPFCNIPVFLLPLFICLLFQVSPALPIVCHTPVFLLLPLPYFVSVILFASPPPSPTCYVWLHTLYTTILFSGFSPHLLYICYNSIFQLSHLYYFVIVVNTCVCRRSVDNKALILSYPILTPPRAFIPQPRLLSSLPPLFCVYDSICLPPPPVMYGFTPCTPPSCFQVFPLTYCTSVIILFSNSPTCITPPPPSIPQPRLRSSLPSLFCVYDSICHPPPPVWLPFLYNNALSLLLSFSPILCLLLLWLMFLCGSCSQRQSEFSGCWPPAL